MSKIPIGVAEDQSIYRDGLVNMLNTTGNYEVIVEAVDGKDLIEQLEDRRPKVLLVDYRMPEMSGIQATYIIRKKYPDMKVLILSMYDSNEFVIKAIENGANGYITKDDDPKEIIDGIESVLSTGYYLNDRTSKALIKQLMGAGQVKPEFPNTNLEFSEIELEIIQLICREYSTQEISDVLCKSKRTVEGIRGTIMKKIGARNVIGIVMYAIKNKLVPLD